MIHMLVCNVHKYSITKTVHIQSKMAGVLTLQSVHEQLCSSHKTSGSCWNSWSSLPLTYLVILLCLKGCHRFQHSPLQTYRIWITFVIHSDNNFYFKESRPVIQILTRHHFVLGTSIPPEHPNLCFAHQGTPGPT